MPAEYVPTDAQRSLEESASAFGSGRGAIFLHPVAQFDHLSALPDSVDRAKAIIDAMESIEKDYTSLAGTLPKTEYTELDNNVLGNLLRVFNDPALQKANGDIFGPRK